MRRLLCTAGLLAATALLSGCDPPGTIPVFCGAASATLTEAAPVLRDLRGSCLRARALARESAGASGAAESSACDAVSQQSEGAIAAAALLSRYFDSLNPLAAPAALQTSASDDILTDEASTALAGFPEAQTGLAWISHAPGATGSDRNRQRAAARDLEQASTNVRAITGALASIVQTRYIDGALADEEQRLSASGRGLNQQPADSLYAQHLTERVQISRQRIAERRASAQALVAALHTLDTGVAKLAASARPFDVKSASAILAPCTAQLQAAIPEIQRAF